MNESRTTACNVIQAHTSMPREVASWLVEQLTDNEVATLAVPSPIPTAEDATSITAAALIRAAEAIHPNSE